MRGASKAATGPSLRIATPFDVAGLALVGSGTRLVAGGRDGSLTSWDGGTGELLSSLKYAGPAPTDFEFSADGTLLAVAGVDKSVRVLGTRSLDVLQTMQDIPQVQAALRFSPDAGLLAGVSGGHELELSVWDVARGSRLHSLRDGSTAASAVAFSPDNASMAVGTRAGDVLLLEAMRQSPRRTLSEPLMASAAMAFSLDGRFLVAASLDGVLYVWDRATSSVRRLPAPRVALSVAVSPEGTHLAVSSASFNPSDSFAEALLLAWPSGEVLARQSLGVVSSSVVNFVAPGRVRVATARVKAIEVWNLG
jgi:WD40 repeat protein